VPFACRSCGSPAVVLPEELNDNASVRCEGCNDVLATWGAFKARTTRAILAEMRLHGARPGALGTDPLDQDLLRTYASRS
jgi:hypothetical protein